MSHRHHIWNVLSFLMSFLAMSLDITRVQKTCILVSASLWHLKTFCFQIWYCLRFLSYSCHFVIFSFSFYYLTSQIWETLLFFLCMILEWDWCWSPSCWSPWYSFDGHDPACMFMLYTTPGTCRNSVLVSTVRARSPVNCLCYFHQDSGYKTVKKERKHDTTMSDSQS